MLIVAYCAEVSRIWKIWDLFKHSLVRINNVEKRTKSFQMTLHGGLETRVNSRENTAEFGFYLVSLSLQCISVRKRFEESRPIIWDDVCFHHNQQLLLQHVYETFQVWQPLLFVTFYKLELKTKYIFFYSALAICILKMRLELEAQSWLKSCLLPKSFSIMEMNHRLVCCTGQNDRRWGR